MISDQSNETGDGLRQELTLPVGNNTERRITATVTWKALGEDRQAQFDAEIQMLLAQLARQQIERKRDTNAR